MTYNIRESIGLWLAVMFLITVISLLGFMIWGLVENWALLFNDIENDTILPGYMVYAWVWFCIGANGILLVVMLLSDDMFDRSPKYKRKLDSLREKERKKKETIRAKRDYDDYKIEYFELKNKLAGNLLCAKCDKKIQKGAVFCSNCGQNINKS